MRKNQLLEDFAFCNLPPQVVQNSDGLTVVSLVGIGDDPTAPGYIGDHPDPAIAFKGFERHPGAVTTSLPH